MKIRQLECFIAVAECLNFSMAAKRMFIGQSALSQQISALEFELNTKLFERTTNSVHLTKSGEVLLTEAKAIILQINSAIQKVKMANSGSIGNLNIGFLALVASQFLPRVSKEFLNRHPQIDLNLLPLNQVDIRDNLLNENIDLAFTREYGLSKSIFDWTKVQKDNLTIVMRHDHPLAKCKKIKLSLLSEENFITYSREVSEDLLKRITLLCGKSNFVPNIVQQTTRAEAILFMIEANVGISILNQSIQKIYKNKSLRFIDIDTNEDISNDLVLAWKVQNKNPIIQNFISEFDTIYPLNA